MADYSGTLKKFRETGYPKPSDGGEDDAAAPESVRSIKLSDEEMKGLESYQIKPGEEIVFEVNGKLEGNTLRVMSAKYASSGGKGEDANADAEAVMAQMRGPMLQQQTIPSPS